MEYRLEDLAARNGMTERLNELAGEGWRVVSVCPNGNMWLAVLEKESVPVAIKKEKDGTTV